MTLNVYKEGKGWYKIIVFSAKHGLETYKIKGKKEMRKKVRALEGLKFAELPRDFQVLKDGKVHTQFSNREQAIACLKFNKRTDLMNKDKYTLNFDL